MSTPEPNEPTDLALSGAGPPFVRQVSRRVRTLPRVLGALRPHQWSKNVLLFVPLVLSHAMAESQLLWQAGLAFVCFSMTASAIYVINDLLDLADDRRHPTKRMRPFASGELPLIIGFFVAPTLLLLAGLLAAFFLPRGFFYLLGGYVVATTLYSFGLKRVVLLDVLLLAGLYTLRLVAGAEATGMDTTNWLIAFSMFLFLSLAFVKRYAEVRSLPERELAAALGRGYRATDLEPLAWFGAASGYIAALVLALYLSSDSVTRLYSRPDILWFMVPALVFWVSRVWLIAHRGEMHDDPVVFALKDKSSYILGAVVVATALIAL